MYSNVIDTLDTPGEVGVGVAVMLITENGGGVFDWAVIVRASPRRITATTINPLVAGFVATLSDIEITENRE